MANIPVKEIRDIIFGDVDSWELYMWRKGPQFESYICIMYNDRILMTSMQSISMLAWTLKKEVPKCVTCLPIKIDHLIPLGGAGKKELLIRMVK